MTSNKRFGPFSLILGWVLIGLAWNSAQASEDAYAWLQKVQEATRHQNFSGTLLYRQGDHSEALKVARLNDGGNIREKMYSLTGSYREVVRNNDQIWCYFPDKQLGIKDIKNAATSPFPGFLPKDITSLKDHYDLKLGKTMRLAGRECQEIRIIPKDQYRYGYRLYADKQSGLLLGADMLDAAGEKLESYMFTDVHIGDDISKAALAPSKPQQSLVWRIEEPGLPKSLQKNHSSRSQWRSVSRPQGFKLTGSAMSNNGDKGKPVEQLVYSDGLATVSVFIRELAKADQPASTPPKSLRRLGAVNALGMVMDGHQITVVGEVPTPTLELIGTSLDKGLGGDD